MYEFCNWIAIGTIFIIMYLLWDKKNHYLWKGKLLCYFSKYNCLSMFLALSLGYLGARGNTYGYGCWWHPLK